MLWTGIEAKRSTRTMQSAKGLDMTKQLVAGRVFAGLLIGQLALLPVSSTARACCEDAEVTLSGGGTILACEESQLSAHGTPPGGTYSWSASGEGGTVSGNGDNATFTGSATGGTATVQVTYTYICDLDPNNPIEKSDTASVSFVVAAVVDIRPHMDYQWAGQTQTYTAVTNPPGYGSYVQMSVDGGFTGEAGTGSISAHACDCHTDGRVFATCGCSQATLTVPIWTFDGYTIQWSPCLNAKYVVDHWDPDYQILLQVHQPSGAPVVYTCEWTGVTTTNGLTATLAMGEPNTQQEVTATGYDSLQCELFEAEQTFEFYPAYIVVKAGEACIDCPNRTLAGYENSTSNPSTSTIEILFSWEFTESYEGTREESLEQGTYSEFELTGGSKWKMIDFSGGLTFGSEIKQAIVNSCSFGFQGAWTFQQTITGEHTVPPHTRIDWYAYIRKIRATGVLTIYPDANMDACLDGDPYDVDWSAHKANVLVLGVAEFPMS